ncbi:Peptidoglycan/xylan/chitin deacetylase, PgdA/CDA1 family [Clostridium cavendishii DSM 21758]|uniref:Peptidoglycan/xylan/chitin deacetylase, PgdA/CDA1 family n=1 Tax=Clostridium cavendishii DSM 21758 TaxID=1121302 RepID=A0A1M6U9X2_9CLOT|nr:polysaccharide deacetylase family protein [Clostridium cavendishii]SHK66052.1 Peptidoglycan/xylan/chitin deacetylase, PgdA/CDA1 family [Clostridium cavendishii DSM 21758]
MKKNNFYKKKKHKMVISTIVAALLIVSTGLGIKNFFFNKQEKNKVVQASVEEEKSKESNNKDNKKHDDYSIDRNDVANMLNGKYPKDGKKYVFLTFDDGPNAQTTEDILNILKEKDVKATFFVLGSNIEKSDKMKSLIKREIEDGHAIGNHSYSHKYDLLYPKGKVDIKYFMEEIDKTNEVLKSVLGEDFETKVIRMPGGHLSRHKDPNINELDKELEVNKITNIDWNCVNGDAEGKPYTEEQMLENVKKSSKNTNKAIVLMHDAPGKKKTRDILSKVIDYFKEQGYEFKTIK